MSDQPANIVIIQTDQLSAGAVGAWGNEHVRTPHIDSLAARGMRLANTYTPCPLCRPARASTWTGLLPHATRALSNRMAFHDHDVDPKLPTLGELFSAAGYRCMHFGKTHDAGSLRGFEVADPALTAEVEQVDPWPARYNIRKDAATAAQAERFLAEDHDQPFLLIADFHQPHDICEWIGLHQGAHDDEPIPTELPPLPENFITHDFTSRPLPVQYTCCSHRRLAMATPWTEENYRHYLAAYYHYVRRADEFTGRVLQAIDARSDAGNTLIVFMADHGEGMAAHRMVTKQVSFYEGPTHVPMIVAGPRVATPGEAIDKPTSLVDLLPTLCDYAGIDPPGRLHGVSLLPELTGRSGPASERKYVVSQWHTEWGLTVEPGRMIRTDRYKYTRYLEGDGEELFDMVEDPGETRTLIDDPDRRDALEHHRGLLEQYLRETGDPFLEFYPVVHPMFRSHEPGYANHRGANAREVFDRAGS